MWDDSVPVVPLEWQEVRTEHVRGPGWVFSQAQGASERRKSPIDGGMAGGSAQKGGFPSFSERIYLEKA